MASLFPQLNCLLIWESLCAILGIEKETLKVIIYDVRFPHLIHSGYCRACIIFTVRLWCVSKYSTEASSFLFNMAFNGAHFRTRACSF